MEYRQRWFFEEGRDLFKVIRRYWLLNAKCFNKDKCLLRGSSFGVLSLSVAAIFPSAWSGEEQLYLIMEGRTIAV
jgi:hypothetical protein